MLELRDEFSRLEAKAEPMNVTGMCVIMRTEDGFVNTTLQGDMSGEDAERYIRQQNSGLSMVG